VDKFKLVSEPEALKEVYIIDYNVSEMTSTELGSKSGLDAERNKLKFFGSEEVALDDEFLVFPVLGVEVLTLLESERNSLFGV